MTRNKIGFHRENEFTLAAGNAKSSTYGSMIAPKTVARTRKDIANWNRAIQMTRLQDNPKWYLLQQLYDEIFLDALLKSQYKNRILKALSEKPVLKKPNGEIDEEQTNLLNNAIFTKEINRHILDSNYRGFSVIEFSVPPVGVSKRKEGKQLQVDLIPRANIDPVNGALYPDYSEDKKIFYRDTAEYGVWLLEFHEKGNEGLFNSGVPHVLFKRFAQSCWSELCEINGIPPRVLKTNTQDPEMMRRGESMMQDMGAAAWFIIDENESFEWAAAATQSGDVYSKLINLCNNEISLLFSGAIIGQDTKHGNRSKEESSQDMLQTLIDNDLDVLEKHWNDTVIPALVQIGILKGDVTYEYEPSENIEQLWGMTKEILPYKKIDDEWIKEKFGIEVTGDRGGNDDGAEGGKGDKGEKLSLDFFD